MHIFLNLLILIFLPIYFYLFILNKINAQKS